MTLSTLGLSPEAIALRSTGSTSVGEEGKDIGLRWECAGDLVTFLGSKEPFLSGVAGLQEERSRRRGPYPMLQD